MGLLGILVGLGLLIFLAFRGWSVLLLAPAAALVAAVFAGEPLLAHWTQTFMGSAARFVAQFFPLFLLGALFGKLMDDSGSVTSIAEFMTEKLGPSRAMLAVVLAGALVTYGGVSLFVAFFVLAPMGLALFRAAGIPRRLMPAAIALGTSTFTMSALPGTPSIQNAIPMPFFGTTPFAAPGLGVLASIIMLAFGLWWLARAEGRARAAGEGFGDEGPAPVRSGQRTGARARHRLAILRSGGSRARRPCARRAAHRLRAGAAHRGGGGQSADVAGRAAAARRVLSRRGALRRHHARRGRRRVVGGGGAGRGDPHRGGAEFPPLPALRATMDAGANASVLPIFSVASLVGFGAVVAAMPAFELVRSWVLGIEGGPLVSLAVATNILAALTGSASGGLTIALDSLGPTFMKIAAETGLDPALMHRVAVIGSGTLDSLPHNGAVVTLLAVCGTTHKQSYLDIVMVGIVGAVLALIAVIVLGSMVGSF